MIELEKKLPLTKEEYTCLLEHFGQNRSMVKQVNYYFDTEQLSMNHQNITCRIRLKNGQYQATMKCHAYGKDQNTETELEIWDGIKENSFTRMGLQLQGMLITERCVLTQDAEYEVVLDKNNYLGYTDYEIEIEYSPNHEQDAATTLKQIIDVLISHDPKLTLQEMLLRTKHVPSKSKRFFTRRLSNDFNL